MDLTIQPTKVLKLSGHKVKSVFQGCHIYKPSPFNIGLALVVLVLVAVLGTATVVVLEEVSVEVLAEVKVVELEGVNGGATGGGHGPGGGFGGGSRESSGGKV